jgi:hypothetical protein
MALLAETGRLKDEGAIDAGARTWKRRSGYLLVAVSF